MIDRRNENILRRAALLGGLLMALPALAFGQETADATKSHDDMTAMPSAITRREIGEKSSRLSGSMKFT